MKNVYLVGASFYRSWEMKDGTPEVKDGSGVYDFEVCAQSSLEGAANAAAEFVKKYEPSEGGPDGDLDPVERVYISRVSLDGEDPFSDRPARVYLRYGRGKDGAFLLGSYLRTLREAFGG